MPFSVPVGEEEDGGAMTSFSGGEQLGVDGVVFRPGRCDEAGEGENIFAVEAVIGGGRGGVPFPARFDRFAGVLPDECSGIGLIGCTAEVLALLGYFTSEPGATQAQRYVESPGRFDPCIPYTPGEKAWAPHA